MSVFWNETAFLLCSATDSCWNRKVDSLASPMLAVRILISCTSSAAWGCHVPTVSMATGTNTWVLNTWLYLVFLLGLIIIITVLWCLLPLAKEELDPPQLPLWMRPCTHWHDSYMTKSRLQLSPLPEMCHIASNWFEEPGLCIYDTLI